LFERFLAAGGVRDFGYSRSQSFYQEGGGTPNLFTVSQMAFFRAAISNACFYCMLLQDINKRYKAARLKTPGEFCRECRKSHKEWKRRFAEMHGFCDKIKALKH
jgi:hypothetical protein